MMKHVFYINLSFRNDRRLHIETQLRALGLWDISTRFNAIHVKKNGAIGCTLSHLKCLEMAKNCNWENVCIVEDDFTVTDIGNFKTALKCVAASSYDVLLLGGNNVLPVSENSHNLVKVNWCQTTIGYIVKQHYYDTLIQNIKEGLAHLMRAPLERSLYAIDMWWIQLQKKDNWYLLVDDQKRPMVTQLAGYSDIEERHVNYERVMTKAAKMSE